MWNTFAIIIVIDLDSVASGGFEDLLSFCERCGCFILWIYAPTHLTHFVTISFNKIIRCNLFNFVIVLLMFWVCVRESESSFVYLYQPCIFLLLLFVLMHALA